MKIIAHRGASGYAPENTMAAFELAVKMGSRAFEFDVHRTRDGKLVVHHDYEVRPASGKAEKIADLNYAELRKISVGNKFGFPAERVPLLGDVLGLLSGKADWVNFEIKNDGNVYPGIEAELTAMVKGAPWLEKKALFSSFDYGTLRRLRALDPDLQLGYLGHWSTTGALAPAIILAKAVRAVNFHINLRVLTRLHAAVLRSAGFRVCVYTVNSKADALRMERFGVDGIFSDFPDVLSRQGGI